MRRWWLPLLTALGLLLPCAAQADIVISEVMTSNAIYENGEAYDWVELYNNGSKTVNLSGWFLSDNEKKPQKWSFPEGTTLKAGSFLTVFCTGDSTLSKGKNSTFYADFKLSSSGETLLLSDAEGTAIQLLALPSQYGCVSYGLAPDGVTYAYLETATRNATNKTEVGMYRVGTPVIQTTSGFYRDAVTVQASAPEGSELRYTLNGETPTRSDALFPAEGLLLEQTAILRVKAFADGAVSSQTVSATYFLNEEQLTPIVSLITDDKYLFNSKTGALVKGTGSTPNYEKELEYPVNIEYFNADGLCEINQIGTFSISGHSATVNAQKSLALFARKALGAETFQFNPFPTRDYTEYKSLLLRSTNSDAYATRLRDVVASSLAEGEGLLYQDAVCIQVYINGQYWGHYNLREKINKYFVAQYEGVTDEYDIDRIDILSRTGRDEFVQNGSNEDWLALCDFCKTSDLNIPENLQYVEERLDIDSLFTHAAYEIILGNVDFTNVRVYRVPGGKWKYLLFDVEACWRGLDRTPLEYYIKPVSGKIQGFRHEPLNALLNVPEMKARFLQRVAELLEKHFQWPDVEARFDAWTGILEQILPRHIARWKNLTMEKWHTNVDAVKYYARMRPKKIPELLQQAMKLTDAEVETYFGSVLRLLEETNTLP